MNLKKIVLSIIPITYIISNIFLPKMLISNNLYKTNFLNSVRHIKTSLPNTACYDIEKAFYCNANNMAQVMDIGIPVLCYHDVNPTPGNPLLLHPNKFRNQMQYLKDHGYTPLSMDQLYLFLKEDGALPEKPVVLTFDDGYVGNYTYAFPILKEFGFKATIFMISDCIDLGPYMTSEQIKEMSSYGIDIESHTTNHCDLSKMSLKAQTADLEKSKEKLEHLLNKPIDYLAYPYGKYNMDTRKAAAAAGYKLGFSIHGTLTDKKDNPYNLDRLYVSNNNSMADFISILSTKSR